MALTRERRRGYEEEKMVVARESVSVVVVLDEPVRK